MATPLDSTLPANDPDFFTTGNAELSRTDQRAMIGHGVPFSGHILELAKGSAKVGGTNVVAVRN
jgi:hypothetical protein